ncbi:prolipoprotein diacylglyceryl transferase family protein [Dethiosulfatarculus sandiegensis]|uniref:Prolipoprotein diacylglyceryl transferase n=1 Tax=Dethiosulfatarculus sandiegensis TaxID=1429043 RepID=A0A0D2JA60_9BACT|nr:prolipoprotein diacylglyceryl transferase family protein [Dethiosulfatarculus sandiegensis]KIX12601.1 hypothetical protein X474_18525 [Dethiosulfatarculus sandiegensis]
MINEIFVLGLAGVYGVLLFWACRSLPGEKWQIACAIPTKKDETGHWQGRNVTYYGIFSANALALSLAMIFMMLGSLRVSAGKTLLFMAPLLLVCIPASSLVARWVEKKPATLTIGGASFVGLILAPWLVLATRAILGDQAGAGLRVLPVMACLTVCYAFGEGLGRLACVSFGCCYGKPISECPALIQKLFGGLAFRFEGHTKKIAYESGWEGRPVLPVQAITSVIYVGTGLLGLYLFLLDYFSAAFYVSLLITGLWRAYSETLRADYRGKGKLSAYQWMALASIPYGVCVGLLFPVHGLLNPPDAELGFLALWNPWVLILLQALWLAILVHSGASKVTASTISFHVVKDKT